MAESDSRVVIVKPIVYGNVARYLGATREDGHTHEWTVYLKSYTNEDMSSYIKKVAFKLHDSYAEPNRICLEPPYKVTESGWGEFEVIIKIHFFEPNHDRAVTIYHPLKLFNPHPVITDYLVSESYDELIFAEPSPMMYDRLLKAHPLPPQAQEPVETDFEAKKSRTIVSIMAAKSKIRTEIEELRKRIEVVKEDVAEHKVKFAAKNAEKSPTKTPTASTSATPSTSSTPSTSAAVSSATIINNLIADL